MTKSSAAPRRLKIVKIVIFSSSFEKFPKTQPSALLVRASYNLKDNNIAYIPFLQNFMKILQYLLLPQLQSIFGIGTNLIKLLKMNE